MSNLVSRYNRSLSVLSWNVHGLDDPEKCNVIREAINSANPSIMCIQESKLHEIDQFKVKTLLPLPPPPQLTQTTHFLPAIGFRGGIITAWNPGSWSSSAKITRTHSLTSVFNSTLSDLSLTVTNVTAPQIIVIPMPSSSS